MAETLQDFLVSIKYHVDAASQQNLFQQLGHTTERLLGVKTGIVALTTSLMELTKRAAEMGDQWYWMSQRMGSSVLDIKSAAFAMSNLGISSQQALGAMENFAKWEVSRGAMSLGFLRMYGVTAREMTGQMRQLGEVFRQRGLSYENMWGTDAQRNQFARGLALAQSMGFDMATALAMASGEMAKLADYSTKLYESMGLNKQAMQDFAKSAHELNVQFKMLSLEVHAVWDAFAAELVRQALPAITRLNEIIHAHMPELATLARAFADAVAFLVNTFVTLVDVFAKVVDNFEELGTALGLAKSGVSAFQGVVLALDAVLLRSALGRWVLLFEFLLELFKDYQAYTHGGKSYINWGPVDQFSTWVDDLTHVKGLLWDILGILGLITLTVGPSRLGKVIATTAATTAGAVTSGVAGVVAAPAAAAVGIGLGIHEAESTDNVTAAKKLYGSDNAGSLFRAMVVRLHAWVNGQSLEDAAREVGGAYAPRGAPGASATPAPTPASVGEVRALPGDMSWGDYGTRANNPGNMNWAAWEGASGRFRYTDEREHREHVMATFGTMAEGVAAAYKLWVRNQARYGTTVKGGLTNWASIPYTSEMGIDPNAPFDITKASPEQVATILQAQFRHEGRPGSHSVTHAQIMQGIALARRGGDQEPGWAGRVLVGQAGHGGVDQSVHQTNNIVVNGAGNPHDTGVQVGAAVNRANQSLVRAQRDILR